MFRFYGNAFDEGFQAAAGTPLKSIEARLTAPQ
jgi:hypothetical protein